MALSQSAICQARRGHIRFRRILGWCILSAILTSTAWAANLSEVEYAKGIMAYGSRDYLTALKHFRNVTASAPGNPHARFYLGLVLSRIGEFQQAIDEFNTALRLDSTLSHVHRPLGLAYLKAKRYPEALRHFALAVQAQPERAETQFYLGYTHVVMRQYRDAIPVLQWAAHLDPKILPKAQYHQGVALFSLERDDQARAAFEAVVAAAPDSGVAGRARNYLDIIEKRAPSLRFIQLRGSFSLEYDDNVILEPNEIEIARQSDGRAVFAFTAKLLPFHTPRWRLGGSYTFFQSKHFDLSDFDVQSHTGQLFARLKMSRATLRTAADYTYTLLDNAQLSAALSVKPSATIKQSKTWFATISLRYRLSNYFGNLPMEQDAAVRDRDGWSVKAGVTQYVSFNKKRSLAHLSYHYEAERAEGSDWEFNGHHIGLGLHTPLPWDIVLQMSSTYRQRDYLHLHSFAAPPLSMLTGEDRDERLDDTFMASVKLSRPLGSSLRLALKYAHTNSMSNLDFFDFRRNIVTVTLSGRY